MAHFSFLAAQKQREPGKPLIDIVGDIAIHVKTRAKAALKQPVIGPAEMREYWLPRP